MDGKEDCNQQAPDHVPNTVEADSRQATPAPPYSSVWTTPNETNVPDIAELPGDTIQFDQAIHNDVKARDDGRVEIDCSSRLIRSIASIYQVPSTNVNKPPSEEPQAPVNTNPQAASWALRLNIVIQVVGSRGDVQPFVALGTELQRHGHRVRLATHDIFDEFVRDAGLEFYPVGGAPAELMAYMVKNPGLIPSMESLAAGEIQKKRDMVEEMLGKFWESCTEKDPYTGNPFVADAIIANPPSFAHLHCAQALGIPIHLMFTMPWSSTGSFPHPLANLRNVKGDASVANYMSYDLVEWMTWQGLGDIINKWRKSIDLEEVAMFDGPLLIKALKIPFTYYVCGFFFRDTPKLSPPADLTHFLQGGPPPVYIGFGSIVLDKPEHIINIILGAVRATGIRAIISKGWSDLAGLEDDNVYWIAECPHEWLFQHVAAVVHHGGAGTTACGLRNGKPTAVVPFFGDQPFWGEMVAEAGAGPRPVRHQDLSVENLSESIRFLLSKEAQAAAAAVAAKMEFEVGAQAAVRSFHKQLPLERMQCDLIPGEPVAWTYTKSKHPVHLSKLAAGVLISTISADAKHFKLHESKTTIIETTRWEPISGGASAVLGTATDLTGHLTGIVTKPIEEYRSDRRRRDRDLRSVASHSLSVASVRSLSKTGNDNASLNDADFTDARSSGSLISKPSGSLAGRMAGGSAMSIVNFAPTALKGMTVDIPLAITEGLRAVPNYYGGSVRDNGTVTDIKSGLVVAGKSFAWGFADGLSDVVTEPYKGARNEGALGAAKGVGRGVANLVTKSGAGMFGLFAYTSSGIRKSTHAAMHGRTRKKVACRRHEEGLWMVEAGKAGHVDPKEIVLAFNRLLEVK